ncbi:hypothetical protein [Streptococcus suis]|uniref:hypothetical protein n=1 Tax=Streptococcus suis TaxID=1307 RepID=UPI0038BA4853
MEKLSQGLEWIGRKIWVLLRVFIFLVFCVIPDMILEESKSQTALVMAGLVTLGLLVFFWWRAEKMICQSGTLTFLLGTVWR